MLSGHFEPHFRIRLVENDPRNTEKTAGGGAAVRGVSALRGVSREAIEREAIEEKLGDFNVTAVVKLFVKEP
jgi:hypothetical protein